MGRGVGVEGMEEEGVEVDIGRMKWWRGVKAFITWRRSLGMVFGCVDDKVKLACDLKINFGDGGGSADEIWASPGPPARTSVKITLHIQLVRNLGR